MSDCKFKYSGTVSCKYGDRIKVRDFTVYAPSLEAARYKIVKAMSDSINFTIENIFFCSVEEVAENE